ncbi:MAG TPA: hypothetical protein VEU78_05055 [Steroidobacteraceae bacterium]|nr:hypothetical protein [Steroidobacteraceae bacterium]
MEFLLFDVGATLVFLIGYRTVVTLQRRRAGPATLKPRREWPRLSHPR